jgi:hypothetical protein
MVQDSYGIVVDGSDCHTLAMGFEHDCSQHSRSLEIEPLAEHVAGYEQTDLHARM